MRSSFVPFRPGLRLLLAAAVTVALSSPGTHAAVLYTIEDIATIHDKGYAQIDPVLAGSGQMAFGVPAVGAENGVFRTAAGGGLQRLTPTTFPQYQRDATAINGRGDVVGAELGEPNSGFLYTDAQGFLWLYDFLPTDVNNVGVVVGTNYSWALRRTAAGDVQRLWTGDAWGVNDAGLITGRKGGQAVVYSDAGGLVTLNSPYAQSLGFAVNNRGTVLVHAGDPGDGHMLLFQPDGSYVEITPPAGSGLQSTEMLRLNDADQAVGYGFSDQFAALLYTPGGGLQDLNTLIDPASGWRLTMATDINNAGQIVGRGVFGGRTHLYRLTPTTAAVPEPGSLALLAAGASGLLLRRRKR